jgi:hypothetical protein
LKKLLTPLIQAMFLMSMAVSCNLTPAITGFKTEKAQKPITLLSDSPLAEIVFETSLSVNTPPDEPIFLELLDEISGINTAPVRIKMIKKETGKYTIKQTFPLGSLLKYRYSHSSAFILENNILGKSERYRMYLIERSGIIRDIISSWKDIQSGSPVGKINGIVTDILSAQPIPDIFVTAGGISTLTTSDGSFVLEGLPEGTHNLVAYSLDGIYQTFQQGAMIAAGSITPADIRMSKSKTIQITFLVDPPQNELSNLPIRLVGNTYQLGNTFSDIFGDSSILASQSPLLTIDSNGKYSLQIILPTGFDFQYKYSLGDGYWNSEYDSQGNPILRQFIVPETDTTIEDSIATWNPSGNSPINFLVKAPENTPTGESISLQINKDGWSNPIPMWSLGNNQWLYVLYNPNLSMDKASYRYCRNDQCGIADDIATTGKAPLGLPVAQRLASPDKWDVVQSWAWWPQQNEQTQIVGYEVTSRGSEFFAGVEISQNEQPSWKPYLNSAFQDIQSLGANWVVMTPSMSYTLINPPILESVPGEDPLWSDTLQASQWAQNNNLKVAFFPIAKFKMPGEIWWQQAHRDTDWWQNWFDRYQVFLLHQADLATQCGAEMLILGDTGILPSLSNYLMIDGSPSGLQNKVNERWEQMIIKVRDRYKGKLAWALSYPNGVQNPPSQISNFDLVYILFSPKLDNPSDDYVMSISKTLDEDIFPIYQSINKPLILGIQYPSIDTAPNGCEIKLNNCWITDNSEDQSVEIGAYRTNLSIQLDIYTAILYSINQRPWISGIISRGYYSPAALMDPTSSVHGKPAASALWYWYPRFLSP